MLHLYEVCLCFSYLLCMFNWANALLYAFIVHFIEDNQTLGCLHRYIPLYSEYICILLTMVATFPLFLSCWTAKECGTFSIGVPLTMTTRSFSLKEQREGKRKKEKYLREVFKKTAKCNFIFFSQVWGWTQTKGFCSL